MGIKVISKYKEDVHGALERFQFIEETLRMYLDVATQIAKIQLAPFFPVNLAKKNFSKYSLGKLTRCFCQFNGNATLKEQLKKVTHSRNRVAHQSLLFTIGELGDNAKLTQLTAEMARIQSNAKEVHEALLEERWKLQRSLGTIGKKNN